MPVSSPEWIIFVFVCTFLLHYNRLSLELLFSIICTKTFCLQRTLSVIRNFNDSLIYNKYGDIQAFFSFVCLMSIFLSINKWMVYKTRQLFMITKKLSSAHSRLISTTYKTFNNAWALHSHSKWSTLVHWHVLSSTLLLLLHTNALSN